MVMTAPKDNNNRITGHSNERIAIDIERRLSETLADGSIRLSDEDERLVDSFFSRHAGGKVADGGFSARVMHNIPAEQPLGRINRLWTAACAVAGIVMFWMFDGVSMLKATLVNMFGNFVGLLANAVTSVNFTYTVTVVAGLVVVGIMALVNDSGEERFI